MLRISCCLLGMVLLTAGRAMAQDTAGDDAAYDVIIRGGTIYDGSGSRRVWPTWQSAATASWRSAT